MDCRCKVLSLDLRLTCSFATVGHGTHDSRRDQLERDRVGRHSTSELMARKSYDTGVQQDRGPPRNEGPRQGSRCYDQLAKVSIQRHEFERFCSAREFETLVNG